MAHGRATDKYRVKLTGDEREMFTRLLRQGRAGAMLKCDEGADGPGWPDAKIAEALDISTRSIENWRKAAVERGPLSLLDRKAQDRSKQRKLDGAGEARLVQLACSTPPAGRGRWSLRLLADELVTLEVVDSIGHEAVRETLKKPDQALASEDVVHPAGPRRGLRSADGAGFTGVFAAVRSSAAGGLHGRTTQAVYPRIAPADHYARRRSARGP